MAVNIPIDNTSIIELVKYLKEMRAELEKATDPKRIQEINADIAETNKLLAKQAETYDVSNKGVRDLRKEYHELRSAAASATDPELMETFAKSAGAAKDRIADINNEIAIFEGDTKFQQAGTALGQMKDALLGLNFEEAALKAQRLADLSKSMTLAEATAGVKNLGSAFLNMGKALLTNPLFLVPALVTTILGAMGLLRPAIEGVKKLFSALGDVLSELSEYLGLTNKEAEKLAESQKKVREESKKQSEAINKESREFGVLIAKLKATNEGSKERDTLIKQINKEYGTTLKNIKDEKDFQGQLNLAVEDYIKQKYAEFNLRANEDKLIELFRKKSAATKEFNEQLRGLTSGYTLVNKETGEYRRNSDGTITTLGELRSRGQIYNKVMLDQEKILSDVDKQILAIGKSSLEYSKITTKTTEGEKHNTEKIVSFIKEIEEEKNKQIEDEAKRQIDKLKLDAENRIKDINATKASEEEKARLILLIRQNLANGIYTIERDLMVKQAELEVERLKLEDERAAKAWEKHQEHIDKLVKETELLNEDGTIKLDLTPKIEDVDLEDFTGKISKFQEIWWKLKAGMEVDSKDMTEFIVSTTEKALDAISSLTQNIGNLLNTFDQNRLNAMEGNEVEQDKIRRKMFERDKKLRIGQAIMDTAMNVTKSIINGGGIPTGIPFGVAAATSGAIQIATIAAQKYNSSAGRVSAPSGGSTPNSTPNYQLFGQPNTGSTVPASPTPVTIDNAVTVKAYVSETDISSAQNKTAKFRNLAAL